MENELKETKKSNKATTVAIVVLILLVLGLSSYIVIDKFNLLSNNSGDNSNNNNNENQTKKFTDTELQELINYVPWYTGIPYDLAIDAYSGENHDINNIGDNALLYMATHNTKPTTAPDSVIEALAEEGIKEPTLYNVVDINKTLKAMYNKSSVAITEAYTPGGTLELYNDYYVKSLGAGFEAYGRVTKIVSYNVNADNSLIIYEKAGFYADSDYPNTYIFDNSYDLNLSFDPLKEDSNAIKELEWGAEEEAETYIKNNWDKFKTFKHTFKLNSYNEYYWYSTEVE